MMVSWMWLWAVLISHQADGGTLVCPPPRRPTILEPSIRVTLVLEFSFSGIGPGWPLVASTAGGILLFRFSTPL